MGILNPTTPGILQQTRNSSYRAPRFKIQNTKTSQRSRYMKLVGFFLVACGRTPAIQLRNIYVLHSTPKSSGATKLDKKLHVGIQWQTKPNAARCCGSTSSQSSKNLTQRKGEPARQLQLDPLICRNQINKAPLYCYCQASNTPSVAPNMYHGQDRGYRTLTGSRTEAIMQQFPNEVRGTRYGPL